MQIKRRGFIRNMIVGIVLTIVTPFPNVLKAFERLFAPKVNNFSKIAFPLVRQVFPQLLTNDIVSVQPMTMASSNIFYLDFKYKRPDKFTMINEEEYAMAIEDRIQNEYEKIAIGTNSQNLDVPRFTPKLILGSPVFADCFTTR